MAYESHGRGFYTAEYLFLVNKNWKKKKIKPQGPNLNSISE